MPDKDFAIFVNLITGRLVTGDNNEETDLVRAKITHDNLPEDHYEWLEGTVKLNPEPAIGWNGSVDLELRHQEGHLLFSGGNRPAETAGGEAELTVQFQDEGEKTFHVAGDQPTDQNSDAPVAIGFPGAESNILQQPMDVWELRALVADTETNEDDLVRKSFALNNQNIREWTQVSFEVVPGDRSDLNDMNLHVQDPADRLLFTTQSQPTNATSGASGIDLQLSGGEATIHMTGDVTSSTVGDAIIGVNQGGSGGTLAQRQPATVYWFDVKTMDVNINNVAYDIRPGTTYGFNPSYKTLGNAPMESTFEVGIKPQGLSSSAPQFGALKAGIAQDANVVDGGVVVSDPEIVSWHSQPLYNSLTLHKKIDSSFSTNGYYRDGKSGTILYSEAPAFGNNPSIQPGTTTSINVSDTPKIPEILDGFEDTNYSNSAHIRYLEVDSARYRADFRIYGVVYEIGTNGNVEFVIPLREATWMMDVDTTASNEIISGGNNISQGNSFPITGGTLAADALTVINAGSNATITFTNPN